MTGPQSAEAVRAGDARACGPGGTLSAETMRQVMDGLYFGQCLQPLRELHCHPRVTGHLRAASTEAEPPFPGAIGSLTGIPVIEHDDMEPGAWEMREDGEVVSSGKLRTIEERAQEIVDKINKAGFLPEGYRFEWK